MTADANILTIVVAISSSNIYAFASSPANMPQWMPAFVKSIANVNVEWIIDSNFDKVKIKFAPSNPFGVLGHVVTLPDGQAFTNPVRVVPNGACGLVTFTLFRHEGMSGAEFARDAVMVARDSQT